MDKPLEDKLKLSFEKLLAFAKRENGITYIRRCAICQLVLYSENGAPQKNEEYRPILLKIEDISNSLNYQNGSLNGSITPQKFNELVNGGKVVYSDGFLSADCMEEKYKKQLPADNLQRMIARMLDQNTILPDSCSDYRPNTKSKI